MNSYFLFLKSKDLRCSHNITPLVFVLSSNAICKGNLLSVFVIGHTIASFAFSLKILLLITTAGLYPFFSCHQRILYPREVPPHPTTKHMDKGYFPATCLLSLVCKP